MMTIALRRFERRDGSVLFALDPLYRFVFAALAVFLVVGLIARGEPGWGPAIVLAVILAGTLYDERWLVDPTAGTLSARTGLLVLARRRSWRIDEVEQVVFRHHRAGSLPGTRQQPPEQNEVSPARIGGIIPRRRATHYLWYAIGLSDGTQVRVEMRRVRDWDRDLSVARSFAEALGVKLVELSE